VRPARAGVWQFGLVIFLTDCGIHLLVVVLDHGHGDDVGSVAGDAGRNPFHLAFGQRRNTALVALQQSRRGDGVCRSPHFSRKTEIDRETNVLANIWWGPAAKIHAQARDMAL
jgi:hypothetical protein